ncbi:MAG: box helicase [Bacteroidetes bacterium]|jgi:ATP-dependent RNA helicase RhlE|nr:box helicase [Bacteroidota bacterium]
MTSFEDLNLNRPLMNALDDLQYLHPTPIQEKAFPVIMSGRDVVGIAQTGTGKTFAYLLPILRQLTFSKEKHPRVLIVVPTRELVLQIVAEIKKLTAYSSIRYQGIYGGTNITTQKQLVYDGLDILVATPGRLVDIVLTGILRLKSIQKLVLDEVDQLLGLGFQQQLNTFLETLPVKRQNILFSATMNEEIEKLLSKYFNDPMKIEIAAHGTPLEKIEQKVYHVPNFYTKANLLEHLISTDAELNKVLVFTNTIRIADRLLEHLNSKIPNTFGIIHSGKSQAHRIRILKEFKEGKIRVLIASDVAARGLDISDVSHVINFEMPEVPEDYIHRIGRTGRANKDGIAISFANDQEQELQDIIETMMKKGMDYQPLPSEVKVTHMLIEEEESKPKFDKAYLKAQKQKAEAGPAFHEKSLKNQKVNLGGPAQREKLKGKNAKKRTRRHDS